MVDLTHVDLLALIRRDVPLERAAATGGGEWAGPCPWCGGEDRFRVWPRPPEGNPNYWCRRCGASGDAISYLRAREPGLGFREACERLGVAGGSGGEKASEAGGWRVSRQVGASPAPPNPPRQRPRAAALISEAWQTRARELVQMAQETLWSGPGAPVRDYLRGRGLGGAVLRRMGLGCLRVALREPRSRWGLGEADGRMVWVPPGVVIPWELGGRLWRVNVRRWPHDGEGRKYAQPPGSAPGLYNADALAPGAAAVLVEGEFCALSLMQAVGERVVPVATGSAGGARRLRWLGRWARAGEVILACDADEAGDAAAAWWAERLENARRLRPTRRDVNAMLAAGDDLRAWLGR